MDLAIRILLDIGGICFGLSAFASPNKLLTFRTSLIEIGCFCFGVAAILDFLKPWGAFK